MSYFSVFKVGWPPTGTYSVCLTPVLVWQTLSVFAPALSVEHRRGWAVFEFYPASLWTRGPHAMRVTEKDGRGILALATVCLWSALAVLMFLAPDPVWIERCFTILAAALALGCLVDMVCDLGLSSRCCHLTRSRGPGRDWSALTLFST